MARPISELKHKRVSSAANAMSEMSKGSLIDMTLRHMATVRELETKNAVLGIFISELASMYLPTEDGPEASELAFLRVIMEARLLEREHLSPTEPNPHRGSSADMYFADEACGIWPDAPEVD